MDFTLIAVPAWGATAGPQEIYWSVMQSQPLLKEIPSCTAAWRLRTINVNGKIEDFNKIMTLDKPAHGNKFSTDL